MPAPNGVPNNGFAAAADRSPPQYAAEEEKKTHKIKNNSTIRHIAQS